MLYYEATAAATENYNYKSGRLHNDSNSWMYHGILGHRQLDVALLEELVASNPALIGLSAALFKRHFRTRKLLAQQDGGGGILFSQYRGIHTVLRKGASEALMQLDTLVVDSVTGMATCCSQSDPTSHQGQ